jgi:hypothetical protein
MRAVQAFPAFRDVYAVATKPAVDGKESKEAVAENKHDVSSCICCNAVSSAAVCRAHRGGGGPKLFLGILPADLLRAWCAWFANALFV